MPILSIIILSYNTKEITHSCLEKLVSSLMMYPDFDSQVIIVDNASEDGSQDMITSFIHDHSIRNIQFSSIFNAHNEGFPKGNNVGIANAQGKYFLFLNSDVMIESVNWPRLMRDLEGDNKCGAATVRVNLPSHKIDPASHRGFPSVWNSFCYYSKLEALSRTIPYLNKVFGGYHLTHHDLNTPHEVDAISGAFFLGKAEIIQKLGGFDEDFFMYGEDIDLAYRMKQSGFKIMYLPQDRVLHLKYQSGMKKGEENTQSQTKKYFYDAMRIFYKKHYEKQNLALVNALVYFFIDLKERL